MGQVFPASYLIGLRAGLETTLLFFASAQGGTSAAPLLRLGGGLLTSVVIGVGLYAGAIRINLSPFFLVSGALLVLVAAGINITPQPSVLETIAWVAYPVPVLVLFLLPARASRLPARKPVAAPAPVPNVVSETPQHVEARA